MIQRKPTMQTFCLAIATMGLFLLVGSPVMATDFTWLGQNNNWEDPNNWDFQGLPDGAGDTATISAGPVSRLNANRTIGELRINGPGGQLETNGFRLVVDDSLGESGLIRLSGGPSPTGTTTLLVNPTTSMPNVFDIHTEDLTVGSFAVLQLEGGNILVESDLQISGSSEIAGYGNIEISG